VGVLVTENDDAAIDKLLCFGVILLVVEASASASGSCCCCDGADIDAKEFRNDRTTYPFSCFFVLVFFPSIAFTTVNGTSVGLSVKSLMKLSFPLSLPLPLLLLLYSHDAIGMIAGITAGCLSCNGSPLLLLSSSTDSESDCVTDNSSMVGNCK
jgi:hypothetical protein